MRETVWHFAIILSVTGVVFFTNLGGARLWDRDEPRNAGCAAEMMARGDWVVPMFNDELRHQKPVLLYWLIMSAYAVLGVNEFSARFWSAALAVGTTFATYGIARRLLNSSIAFYAAIALATCLMFDVAARAATPDSLLIFCGTTALLIYVLGTFSKTASGVKFKNDGCWFPQNTLIVMAMYTMLGLGVLAKGPVGFLLPMAIIGMFMLIKSLGTTELRTSDASLSAKIVGLSTGLRTFHPVHFFRTVLSMRPILGATVVLLIAAPWYWLVDARTDGDFTQLFFMGEHFGRATRAMESHRGGLWYYPLAILVGFFPWSIFWGPVAVGLFRHRPNSRHAAQGNGTTYGIATTLMLCWIGVQVGAFSLVQTKLPSYVTPCYPALAILTAICLNQFSTGQNRVSQRWLYAAFGGLVISGMAITFGVGWATVKFLPSQIWLATLGLIPLVGGVVLICLLFKNQNRCIPAVFSLTALLFCTGLFGFGTVSLDVEQQSHRVLARIHPGATIGTYGALESSWIFYANRPMVELEFSDDVDQHQRTRPGVKREKFWQPKSQPTVAAFLKSNPNAMLLTTDEHLGSIQSQLPENYEVIQTADYFLKNKQILLIGRRPIDSQSANDHAESQTAARPAETSDRR